MQIDMMLLGIAPSGPPEGTIGVIALTCLLIPLLLPGTRLQASHQMALCILLGLTFPMSYILLGSDVPAPLGAFVALPLWNLWMNSGIRRHLAGRAKKRNNDAEKSEP
jgi:hypothetical protein